jgi:hypothetical protein
VSNKSLGVALNTSAHAFIELPLTISLSGQVVFALF